MKKYLLFFLVLIFIPVFLFAQSITINWIAMHGPEGTGDLDVTSSGQTIYCNIDYDTNTMDNILNVFGRDNNTHPGEVRILWYNDSPPTDTNYNSSQYVTISNFTSGGLGTSKNATFDFSLPSVPTNVQSFQIRVGLYGEDTDEIIVYSTCHVSYVARGTYTVPSGTPDTGWQGYIEYVSDTSTEAPTLDLPEVNSTIGSSFTFQYDQPETAYEGTVKITFTRTGGSADANSPHVLEVLSEASGTDISFTLTSVDLGSADEVTVISGGTLVDDAIYTVKIEYQDLAQNPAASDDNTNVTFDDDDYLEATGGDYNPGSSFNPGSINNAYFWLRLRKIGSGTNITLDKINFNTTGQMSASDIDTLKIWRSSDNSFSASSDTELVSETSNFDPVTFDFSPDEEINGTGYYYFLTISVSSSASGSDAIGAQVDASVDIDAGTANVSGSFPITGGTHPLPITLSSFTVQFVGGHPTLYWTTQSETNNMGWNIYRSISQNMGQAIHVNGGDPILGQGTTTEPTDYEYEDMHGVEENTTYYYWLESVENSGETELFGPISLTIPEGGGSSGTPAAPDDYGLKQNYPNPFNPDTEIRFALKEASYTNLTIFNIKGEKVKTIFEGSVPADLIQTAVWNGRDESGREVASGIYLYKLATKHDTFVKKMLLAK